MTTSTLARIAAAVGLSLAAAGAANADVFMKVSGMPGDATAHGFEQQISLSGASVSVSRLPVYATPDDPAPTRTTSVGPIVISKSPDRASPRLMLSAVNGEELGSVEITFTSTPRAGGPQVVEDRWILEGAAVQNFQINPGADRHDAPVETVEIVYRSMRYQHYVTDAKGIRTGAMDEVKWDAPTPDPFADDVGCR